MLFLDTFFLHLIFTFVVGADWEPTYPAVWHGAWSSPAARPLPRPSPGGGGPAHISDPPHSTPHHHAPHPVLFRKVASYFCYDFTRILPSVVDPIH